MKAGIWLFVGLTLFGLSAKAQVDSVEWGKVPSKKVTKLLKKNKLKSNTDFKMLPDHCYGTDDSTSYSYHSKSYIINAPIEDAWRAYFEQNPTEQISRRGNVSFGILYSEENDELLYPNSTFEHMTEGQIIFWHLRYMGGFAKLAVGHRITKIDEINHQIKICYFQNGKSKGSQFISLITTTEGTLVVHKTYFKSDSKFRDKHLYPGLHEKAIDEYHENVASYLLQMR